MKIIQVVQTYHPSTGGIETLVRQISEKLVALGHEVEVVTTKSHDSPDQEVINGVLVTRFPAFVSNKSYHIAPRIYGYLKGKEYDVIHAHNYHSLTAFIGALGAHNLVFTSHSNGIGATPRTKTRDVLRWIYKHSLGKYLIAKTDVFIFVTKQEKEIIYKMFYLYDKPRYVIPLPVAVGDFVERKKNSILTVGYLARLAKVKNPQMLCEAVKIIREKYGDRIKLRIAGDGEMMPLLQEKYSHPDTKFLGALEHDKALEFLKTLDIFVMPSNLEVSCISAFEAMAAGVPVISTPIGDLPESFRNMEHLVFTGFNNSDELAQNILLVNENKDLSERLVKNAFLEVKKRDIDMIVQRYLDVYRTVSGMSQH